MRAVRSGLALALTLALAASVHAGPNKVKGGKKAAHPVRGVVVAVQKDQDKDSGTITVRVQAKKKNGVAPAPVERTFRVTPATRFELVAGKKGQPVNEPSTFVAVHKGEHVVIQHDGNQAVDVKIAKRGKKNT
jgi:hypothetical protein